MEIDNSNNKNSPANIAEAAKEKGDKAIAVSIICCKYEPDYLSAVPSYEQAAKNFSLIKNFKEEIYCRDKLVNCHRNLKDTYSEGRELEKIATIYIINQGQYEDAYKYIQNAVLSFRTKGDYKYEINCLIKISESYREKKELEYAEKCLKLAHDEIIKIAHVVTLDKEHSYDYVYKAMTAYIVILILLNKLKETITISREFIKAFEEFEDNKSLIINFFGLIAIAHILLEDHDNVENVFEEAKAICQKHSDYMTMNNIYDTWIALKEGNEEKFNLALRVVDVDYDNALIKKFKEFFTYYSTKILKNAKKDNKVPKSNTIKEKNEFEDVSLGSKKEEKNDRNFADDQL